MNAENDMPTPEKYGYYTQSGFDDEPSGWMFEGGEEAFIIAIDEWETERRLTEKGEK